jgi:hypothetical protein
MQPDASFNARTSVHNYLRIYKLKLWTGRDGLGAVPLFILSRSKTVPLRLQSFELELGTDNGTRKDRCGLLCYER